MWGGVSGAARTTMEELSATILVAEHEQYINLVASLETTTTSTFIVVGYFMALHILASLNLS